MVNKNKAFDFYNIVVFSTTGLSLSKIKKNKDVDELLKRIGFSLVVTKKEDGRGFVYAHLDISHLSDEMKKFLIDAINDYGNIDNYFKAEYDHNEDKSFETIQLMQFFKYSEKNKNESLIRVKNIYRNAIYAKKIELNNNYQSKNKKELLDVLKTKQNSFIKGIKNTIKTSRMSILEQFKEKYCESSLSF